MSTTRRKFVKAGLIATAFAVLPAKSILGQSWKQNDGNPGNTPEVQTNPLGNYSKAAFQSYLNSIFQLHTVNGIVAVTLVSVDDLEAPKGGESFALVFRGGSRAEGQDTYTMVHPSLGTLQLFLVPGGSDENGAQSYVATINRLSLADAAKYPPPTRNTRTQPSKTTAPPASAPKSTPANASPAMTPGTAPNVQPAPTQPPANRPSGRKPSWKFEDIEDPFVDINF